MASPHYGTLRLKIIIMTLSFSLVPLLVMGVTIYYQFSSAYNNKLMEALKTLVQNRRGSLELFFDERISQLTSVAHTHSMEQLKDEAYLNKVFHIIQSRSRSYIDIGVIDDYGNHVAYVGPYYERLKEVNYGNEEWFHKVMSSGVYISDVFLGFRKIPHFIIAVTARDGNRTWILRATINSEIIDNIVRAAQLGKKGDAFIINRNNVLQTPPRLSGELLGRPMTPDFSSYVGTNVEEMDIKGEKNLFGTTQITGKDWILVVKEDPKDEMAPLFKTQYMEALILLGGILLVVTGTILTTRSMTNELIRMEQEKAISDDLVVQSSKMAALGKLAAGIAHEINNPLAIIGEKAGWMKDLLDKEDVRNSENFEEFADCIKKIERQVERSRTITHRLLRFGRRMEPTTEEVVDINRLLAETLTFLENEALYRDITIRTEYDGGIPQVTTDSTQLQQVFLNIINNAIDAVGKGGTISIKTTLNSTNSRNVVVEIADNGPGIPKEVLGKIFDPFFTTKSPQEGTGLGLSISYSIMEKLGGRIAVASEPNEGTTFTITLPVK
ncbi:MAG: two-component sensor histidine kinase [Desulfomonile tiedjei]|nr:two-component sensor histidine kinase [Desulfomonile tiedjei]